LGVIANRRIEMASDLSFVEFVIEQIENAGEITFKKMFGEYSLYSDGKIMALVCDNQLFVKPTKAGRNYIENVIEAPPYPGAKPYFLIEDQLENRDWISELIRITVEELPEPKPKKTKTRRKSK
jgi:TfoX/Sxy family transcriptional regulator of competence genes